MNRSGRVSDYLIKAPPTHVTTLQGHFPAQFLIIFVFASVEAQLNNGLVLLQKNSLLSYVAKDGKELKLVIETWKNMAMFFTEVLKLFLEKGSKISEYGFLALLKFIWHLSPFSLVLQEHF